MNGSAKQPGEERITIRMNIKTKVKAATVISFLFCLLVIGMTQTALADVSNTYNMLLVGADRRDTSWNGNSDTMILVTANYDTQQIYLTSFMRDLYADIPGHGVHKLNYSYAVGGADLLMKTLETNYGVRVDNYMAVDFVTMSELVDMLGGVDLYIKESEIPLINSQTDWMVRTYDVSSDASPIAYEGYNHMNGPQTVSFCRIRYVGNNDYERTERQRRVLTALREKSNALSIAELESIVLRVLAITDNDVNLMDTAKVLTVVKDARLWEQIENRVPYDGMFYSNNEILTPTDMGATVAKLTGIIYADVPGYVSDYSVTIGNDTATIMAVQQALNDAGYNCGNVDGYLGGKTAQAIVDYQKDHDMEESGMIDEQLLRAFGID